MARNWLKLVPLLSTVCQLTNCNYLLLFAIMTGQLIPIVVVVAILQRPRYSTNTYLRISSKMYALVLYKIEIEGSYIFWRQINQ